MWLKKVTRIFYSSFYSFNMKGANNSGLYSNVCGGKRGVGYFSFKK